MQNDAAAANGDLCIANDEDFVLYFPQGALVSSHAELRQGLNRYMLLVGICREHRG